MPSQTQEAAEIPQRAQEAAEIPQSAQDAAPGNLQFCEPAKDQVRGDLQVPSQTETQEAAEIS